MKIPNEEVPRLITSPGDWPEGQLGITEEPIIDGTIVVPKEYMGSVIKLCQDKRGQQEGIQFIDDQRVVIRYRLPLAEVIMNFYDQLKSVSSGYASYEPLPPPSHAMRFDYAEGGFQASDLVKVSMLLNGVPVGSLSIIAHRSKAFHQGKALAVKLKEVIKRQQFEVAIQAAIGKKVIARETLKAFRKDVTAKCYGGDVTRKRKLLEKQKEGKKKMRQIGSVHVPQEAFLAIMKI